MYSRYGHGSGTGTVPPTAGSAGFYVMRRRASRRDVGLILAVNTPFGPVLKVSSVLMALLWLGCTLTGFAAWRPTAGTWSTGAG